MKKIESLPNYKEIVKIYEDNISKLTKNQIWKLIAPTVPVDRATFFRWAKEMEDKSKVEHNKDEMILLEKISLSAIQTEWDKERLKKAAIKLGLSVLADKEQVDKMRPKDKLDVAFRAASIHQAEKDMMLNKVKHDDEMSALDRAIYERSKPNIIIEERRND